MNHFYIVSHNEQNPWGSDLIAIIAPDGVTEHQIIDELEFIAYAKKGELEDAEELPCSGDLECEIFDELVNRFPGLNWHYVRAAHFDYDIDCI